MKKSLLALIFVTLCITLNAAVTYKLSYNSSTQTYTVSFKSTVAYSGPLARITGSTQFTIVAPDPDGAGPGAFTVTNLTNLTALQMGLSQLNSPAENPSKDYLFFAPTNSGSYTPFNIPANTYIDLFTFQTSSGCLASLYLYDNDNDPLNSNMSINADNNFKTLGGGNVNLYTGNDSSNDGCACVTYKLTLDPDGQTYRVSFNSGVGYTGPLARITGSTQFTVVASDPDGAGGASIMITNITNLTGLQMGVSQLNSPVENPGKDYAFFAPLNAGTYTPFNIPANTDIDLFTFKITGNCSGDVYLFDNVSDPLNSNMSINADNNFKTLGGGNNNLYCYNTSGVAPLPNPTITLGSITPVCPGSGSASLPYSATTGGVDQYSIDFDAAAEAAGFVDVTNAALPSSPIGITVPGMATCGTYNATLTVRNSVLNCVSINYNIAVTLQDNGNPVITTCPPTQNLEGCNTGAITGLVFSTTAVIVTQAQFNAAGGVATDGCGIVEYKYIDSQTGSCPIVVTRHWTVTDACGNSAECDQTINIDDTTNPTASNPAPVTVQCSADVPAPNINVVTDEADNCTSAPTVAFVNDVSDGNTCPEIITRTYSVTDACGNQIQVTQTITIDDTTNPTASNPAPVTVQC
ncbi:MAG: hypothetical protein JNL02_16395, partial [Saprospiraceae bacterium]|nr:hypothetical protein [Saprospiraceae bacterium]